MITAALNQRLNLISMFKMVLPLLALMMVAINSYGHEQKTIPPDVYAPIYIDWCGDDDRVAFIFYRPSNCVPSDFNIFDFFHMPTAYFCTPLTVKGVAIYENTEDIIPSQAKLIGLGKVPVWFVSRDDYDAMTEDGDLLFSEIKNMVSLSKGYATFFVEKRHIEGPHSKPKLHIIAFGVIENSDYNSFRLHAFGELGLDFIVSIELE